MHGAELRRWRTRMGLSQVRLAERLGICNATLCRWEAGQARVPATVPAACRQIERWTRQADPGAGPVTLLLLDALTEADPDGPPPAVTQTRFATNREALAWLRRTRRTGRAWRPLILAGDPPEVLWSAAELARLGAEAA